MVGNALEAIVGAIYKDHGYEKTYKAVVRLLKTHGIDQRIHETTDFKSKLHHWAQVEKDSLKFVVIREYHESGEGKYEVEVLADGERMELVQEGLRKLLSTILLAEVGGQSLKNRRTQNRLYSYNAKVSTRLGN